MNQEISLAGVIPIPTGRGTEAMRRKADDRNGQSITAQYLNHTEAAAPAAQSTTQAAPVVQAQETIMTEPVITINQPDASNAVAQTFAQYEDQATSNAMPVTDGISIETTQHVEYEQKLLLDWSTLPDPVMFVFIAASGDIVGTTHEPVPNYETDDFDLVEGQKMIIGQAPLSVRRTTLLTLTEREVVEPEAPVNQLVDVNQDVTEAAPTEEAELPYYHNWGKNRRNRERGRLRKAGKPVPADL